MIHSQQINWASSPREASCLHLQGCSQAVKHLLGKYNPEPSALCVYTVVSLITYILCKGANEE